MKLQRSLGFWALTVYGVGDILGAGIYAMVGKVAGVAGHDAWLSFSVALGVAGLTGLSYAELGSRFPKSGGEAYFTQQAIRRRELPLLVGWLVLCSGVVSLATVSRAFAGYLSAVLPQSHHGIMLLGFLLVLGSINFSGIRQSSLTNMACTVIETSGLLIVIVVSAIFLGGQAKPPPVVADAEPRSLVAIVQGAALGFFAFIGFEDMVNVAEEVRSPRRNLPAAIVTAMAIAGLLYITVVLLATSVVSPQDLQATDAPLVEVVQRASPAIPTWLFTAIALFAVANTGLANSIMASRLLYGMSTQKLLPAWLGAVHPSTRTPHWAILSVFLVTAVLAFSGTLVYLAGTTSVLLLLVFIAVNTSLFVIKRRDGTPSGVFKVHVGVPLAGALSCLAILPFLPPATLLSGAVIIALGLLLVAAHLKRR